MDSEGLLLSTQGAAEMLQTLEHLMAAAAAELTEAGRRVARRARAAADKLALWHCPAEWIVAARLGLSPVYADPATYQAIVAQMPPTVADLADRFHVLNQAVLPHPRGRSEPAQPSFHYLQKLFIASITDEPVTFLALGHMLATLQDLDAQPFEERTAQAHHLRVACLPLLERFGLWEEQRRAADRLSHLLEPTRAAQVAEWIGQYDGRRAEIRDLVAAELRTSLPAGGDGISVTVRPVRVARVLEQSEAYPHLGPEMDRTQAARALASRIALDIVTPDAETCYLVLGCLHRLGRHVTGTLRDYLGSPKYNGYRMIHTTVQLRMERGERPTVDCFICTAEAQEGNLRGRTVEWQPGPAAPRPLPAWWHDTARERALLAAGEPGAYGDPTFVFTPLGELHTLPPRGTPVDFAFGLHSELGQFYTGAQVNGNDVPPDFVLANADIVNVRFDPRVPSLLRREWLRKVQTQAAAAHIKKALAYREQGAERGRQLLEKAIARQCEKLRLTLSKVRLDTHLARAAHWYHCATLEALYLQVANDRPSPDALAARIIAQEVTQRVGYPDGRPLGLVAERVRVAQCCHPALGAPIAGRFSQPGTLHERVNIHAAACPFLPRDERTVALAWRAPADERLYEFLVLGADRKRLLSEALERFHAQDCYLYKVQAERLPDGAARLQILAEVAGAADAHTLAAALAAVPGIREVEPRPLALTPQEAREMQRRLTGENPYRFDQPAYRMGDFLGRTAEVNAIKSFIARPEPAGPLVVYGPWRIGKTSLLKYVEASGLGHAWVAAYVDCRPDRGPSLAGLLGEVIRAITERLAQLPDLAARDIAYLSTQERQNLAEDPVGTFTRFVRQVAAALARGRDIRLVVLLDEFSSLDDQVQHGRLDPRVFDNLRYLMSGELNTAFVLVVQSAALDAMRSLVGRGAGLLEIAELLPLGPLEPPTARDLLSNRAEAVGLAWHDDARAYVAEITGGNPYLLNLVAHHAVEQIKREGRRAFELRDAERAAVMSIAPGHHGDFYFRHLTGATVEAGARHVLRYLGAAPQVAWLPEAEILSSQPGADASSGRELLAALVKFGVLKARTADDGRVYQVQIPLFAKWAAACGNTSE